MKKHPSWQLREWLYGQKSESPYHQAAKYELERREKRTKWIMWGIGIAAVVLAVIVAAFK